MSYSPSLRARISSPLEAGPSVAEAHHLPGHVNQALEYASKRLGRKAAHITLLVVRRDYQLPTSPASISPTFSPACASVPVSAASTPSRPTFQPTSRIDALRQLVRPSNSGEGQIRERIVHVHLDMLRNGTTSPAFSEASAFSASTASSMSTVDSVFSHRMQWPGSPSAYGSVPVTPATPFTVMSSLSGADGARAASRYASQKASQFGTKLVYAHPLSPREEKILAQALEKAAKKFKLDPSWLPQAVSPSTLGLPVDLVLNSTNQHEVLFSSDHLTLLTLDHMYTFRTALQAYARTRTISRLEDAVDELRRFFLANGRRPLRKSALLTAYRWLEPPDDAALADVCRMYERAYGGMEKESGVENDVDPVPAWPLAQSVRGSGVMEQLVTDGMGLPSPRSWRAPQRPVRPKRESLQAEPKVEVSALELTNALNKEILLSSGEMDDDEQDQLDAIEAWYREVHIQNDLPMVEIHYPLRSHPSADEDTAVVEILPPPPSPPPPPPTSSRPPTGLWPKPAEPELSEIRRNTPKLNPAPVGRSLMLKLQTTFDKPAKKQRPTSKQQQPDKLQAEQDDEEQLTARPHSAIKSFANVRWTTTANNGISIDELLHGGGGSRPDGRLLGSPTGPADERVGPMTPNGYDDISPITRGEWGFLMFGKGKTVGVEMC
ncbi:hypothetical protein C8A05DRAFT_17804 [Staphylotrichum tortipilum]|uniref:DUF7582 domain-containing protein n=1 Tax=Staphylotrichum tortipilum TaxID=2831512 RepID=A0AAN6MFH7_9PEZI|nr:hypothetical protein C8A05DRAFT_17804 [Staphylotrichum longicolle]